jgi:TetR/AcrR family transcriptional regulator, transcriptional repressor for nem operon
MVRGRPREFDEKQALQAALEVFWRRGYEGATCEELLSAMGINSGSMYAAFGDKRVLYDRAFDLYCETALGRGMKILDGPGTPLENVKALVRCWGEFMSSPGCKGCFIDHTLIEFGNEKKGVAQLARRAMKRMQDAMEQKLVAARDSGEWTGGVGPAEMAAFLVNTKRGLSVMARAGAGKKAIQAVADTTLSLM